MKRTKHTMAIAILAITVGCTSQNSSRTPPPPTAEVLQVHITADTSYLANIITQNGYDNDNIQLKSDSSNHQNLLNQLNNNEIDYFISHHLPDTTQDYWSAPLLQDGIAVIIHNENLVNDISSEELQRIYRGFIMNWSELGGEDAEIVLYSREEGASIRLEFDRLVMGQQATTPNARVLSSTSAMIDELIDEQYGIGYIPVSMLDVDTNALSIDSITPSVETIADNSYPLRLNIYAIGLESPRNDYQQLFTWIQNLDQEALERYVPLPR